MHLTVEPRVLYFGTPVVLLSTCDEDGSVNLAPMSSAWWVDQSCMLGLDETSQTTKNLISTRECVLNLASSELAGAVDRLALLTGSRVVPGHKLRKGYRYERDKFKAAGLTGTASEKVRPPRVAQCPVQLEAVVDRVHPFGEEGSGLVAVEARVVRVHVEESLLVPGSRRHIDADRWDPLIMKFCRFYGNSRTIHPSRLATAWGIPGA
ncbi:MULTISPECIES: flavin reductase family protein [Streptomyces]|uniref:flavin reductase family protein n=1 Tax=Streptomyces TaxID=1883 RepID=UPI0016770048|nr:MULTISPECIES: flavin reductase family protein [Streptomyces]MBK3527001.1 flavin reductase family protein [Streptomyces sp. MBT70]GGR96586.1 flavin reductase [Streptomyces eurythermus]